MYIVRSPLNEDYLVIYRNSYTTLISNFLKIFFYFLVASLLAFLIFIDTYEQNLYFIQSSISLFITD